MPEAGGALQSVEVAVTIVATPETVFRFFADPERFAEWMGTGSVIEPRAGGSISVCYPHGQIASGRFVEIEPPRRLVFTWGYEGDVQGLPAGSTTVEVELQAIPDGTLLTLRHRDIPTDQLARGTAQGWRYYLAVLAAQAAAAQFGSQLESLVDAWVQAWKERDPLARRALLERCWAVDGSFHDAFAVVDGRSALDEHIAASHALGMDATMARVGPVQQCHGSIRFQWHITAQDGTVAGRGTNFGDLTPAGKLRRVVGFWDMPLH